ncbi:MAG: hypothetical protein JWM25_1155 [Thermoleophilia bacterium]|nr:hypothetical protein [Thermoleophilia bacterium]
MNVAVRPNFRALLTLSLGALLLALGFEAPQAHAAPATTAPAQSKLELAPTRIDVQAKAGEVVIREIQLSARGATPLVVDFFHGDFGFNDASYGVEIIEDTADETTAFSTRGWFSVPKRKITIPAGETVTVPLKITVPDNTPGGTSLGAALFATQPAAVSPGSQINQRSRIGSLVFISVAGGEPPKPKLTRFELPRLQTKGPIRAKIQIDNVGDEWFAYQGSIGIKGTAKSKAIKIGRQVVVPDTPRNVTTTSDKKGTQGRVVVGSKELGFGRHEVVSRLRIEPTGTTLVSTRTVWIVPVWAWTVGILAAIATIIGGILLTRWILQRRAQAQAAASTAAAAAAAADAKESAADEPDILDVLESTGEDAGLDDAYGADEPEDYADLDGEMLDEESAEDPDFVDDFDEASEDQFA